MESEGEKIEVKFITNLEEKYKITEKPFRIPIELGRYGLSGVINHLLSLGLYFEIKISSFFFENLNSN